MSELIKVYSPTGEAFENSPENARDLVNHAGWSYSAPFTPAIVSESGPELIIPVEVVEEIVEPVTEEVVEEIIEPVVVEAVEPEVIEQETEEVSSEEVKTSTRGRRKK